MKITKRQLKQIIKEELNEINWPWSKDKELGSDYRRRKRGTDVGDAPAGALDIDVPHSADQLWLVATMGLGEDREVVEVVKVKTAIPGGYTDVYQKEFEDDREINEKIRGLKRRHYGPRDEDKDSLFEIEAWQETPEDVKYDARFKRGGSFAGVKPQPIRGSAGEVGVLIGSVL